MIERFAIVYFNSQKESIAEAVYHCALPLIDDALITWVKDNCTETAVILVDATVALPDYWQARLLAPFVDNTVQATTALISTIYELSPLPANQDFDLKPLELDAWLSLLSPSQTFISKQRNPHILAVRDVDSFSDLSYVHAVTNLFVDWQDKPLQTQTPKLGDQHPLPAHPLASVQVALAEQSKQLASQPLADYPLLNDKPNVLHVVMDWGGGLQQWLNSYIAADNHHNHFVLTSEGEFYRQRYGERFVLRWQGTRGVALETFELTAPITSVVVKHPEYQKIMADIVARCGIGLVMVSSLIGHAMDCLQTGLPTIRVLHDYFPQWPSLDARLDKKTISHEQLAQALQESREEPFGEISENELSSWQHNLNNILSQSQIKIVAPDVSVLDNMQKLNDSGCYRNGVVIAHGAPALEPLSYVADKEPFTVLVLGRLIAGKGKGLLTDVIKHPALKDVHWLLLGSGDDGNDFSRLPNVKIIKNYRHSELSQLLKAQPPQMALIPARSSETFSYVLSELQMLAIPTLATKVGALKNRIIDHETGQLVSPDIENIAEAITDWQKNPEKRQKIHQALTQLSFKSTAEMVADYQQIITTMAVKKPDYSYQGLMAPAFWAERYKQSHQAALHLEELIGQKQKDNEEKARWAKQLDTQIIHLSDNLGLLKKDNKAFEKQIKSMQQVHTETFERMTRESEDLQKDFQTMSTKFDQSQQDLARQVNHNDELQQHNSVLEQQLQQAQHLIQQIINSRSWRLTRPLRGAARTARHVKNKVGYRMRQIFGMPRRVNNSLKTRGWSATWQLAKQKLRKNLPAAVSQASLMTADYQPLELASVNQPVVSIIVPVYNQFQHTYHCLKSISLLADKTPYEVIVVDDCSSDETSQMETIISGIRYHRQTQNGGFIRSCNKGAQLARGEYLLFLNNDTEVQNNWLDSLVTTFSERPDAGLVGSQLLYPDGRLQEAGGIVFSDGSGWNYGRLESPDAPEFAHLRAVSYCSGASIMIRRLLFSELGQFDDRYVPAYYEDTDLAFAVRAAGLQVYYQPLSRVIHFEGISSGTDLSSGVKKYQIVNQKKFVAKWQQTLNKQAPPTSSIEQARFQGNPRRVLIIDACTPTPDQDSGSLRMLNLIQIYQQLGFQVSFMPENMAHFGRYTEALQRIGVECVYAPKYGSPVDYLRAKGGFFSLVLLSRYYVAAPLLGSIADYAPQAKVWFDTVDLHYMREQRMAELAADQSALKKASQTKTKELAVADACDLTLVVSPYEQQVLEAEKPDLKVAVLSNIHTVYGSAKDYHQRRDLVFMGGYQHTPNVDGVCWFVAEIWPQIQAKLPEVILHIVGSKAPAKVVALGELPGIKFHGFVADIEPMMRDIRIAVAPLRFGAGVKGKVNMSMSYGQPVVGTKVAVEGMYTIHGKDVLMADEPQDFAEQVIRLYQDEALWQQLSAAGLANVEQYFSFAAAKKVVAQLTAELPLISYRRR